MFSSTNHAIQDCLCMIIYNCLNEQNRYCACLLQSSFCVFGIQSCISQLTQDKAICTCSRLLKFFHNFYLCFFQDAACKRPPWTEDHFSRGSFVWREDSTWVGVGINNQIQQGGGGGGGGAGEGGGGGGGGGGVGAHEKFGWRTVLPRPSNCDCFRQKSFILLSSPPLPLLWVRSGTWL